MSGDHVDAALLGACRLRREALQAERAAIACARQAGWTWKRIAAALGLENPQAAQARLASLERRLEPAVLAYAAGAGERILWLTRALPGARRVRARGEVYGVAPPQGSLLPPRALELDRGLQEALARGDAVEWVA